MTALRIVVLAKQVPDTRNVGKDAMKEDGTVNRAALPAIFNPEDMNALEQALRIKDKNEGSTITVVTMGPSRAADIIRDSMFRGADGGILLSDRAFAGSDTLATSYALSRTIAKMGKVDMVICGRQAIDGDTAQVGPQVAEKLGLPQVTYIEEVVDNDDKTVTLKRRLDNGVEIVKTSLPVVITVTGSGARCRVPNVKYTMKYKHARTNSELATANEQIVKLVDERPYLRIDEWNVTNIDSDPEQLGLLGSPTKVKNIESVVLQAKESKKLTASDADIDSLMKELIGEHII